MNKKRLIPIVILILLGTAIGFRLKASYAPETLTGFVEADVSILKSEVNARVVELPADEGQAVKAGDVLARLDRRDISAKIAEAESRVALIQAQLRQAGYSAELAGTEYSQGLRAAGARKAGSEARLELALNGARDEDIQAADAALKQAVAVEKNAEAEFERVKNLYEQGIYSQQVYDKAETALESARQGRRAAEETLAKLKSGSRVEEIQMAKADLAGAEANLSLTRGSEPRVKSAETNVDVVTAQLEAANAQLQQLRILEDKHEIRAPFNGVVQSRIANPGELAAAGSPLFSVYDPARVYLRVYVPLDELPRFTLGASMDVLIDGVKEPVKGEVYFVDDSAQFTPRDVQLPEDRVRQVVAVKLRLEMAELHPGMTASVIIPKER